MRRMTMVSCQGLWKCPSKSLSFSRKEGGYLSNITPLDMFVSFHNVRFIKGNLLRQTSQVSMQVNTIHKEGKVQRLLCVNVTE